MTCILPQCCEFWNTFHRSNSQKALCLSCPKLTVRAWWCLQRCDLWAWRRNEKKTKFFHASNWPFAQTTHVHIARWNACGLESERYYIFHVSCSVEGSRSCRGSKTATSHSLGPWLIQQLFWRLRGNIIWTVLYITNVLPLQWAQLTKTVHTARLGLEFVFVFFRVAWFIFMFMYVLFYLGQLSHFPSCCGAGVTNLNEPPLSFLLPPRYCGLGAGSIPLRAIVNNKQCEMRGLFMSLVIHDWMGDIQDSQCVSTSEMTYILSGGALNSTNSLTVRSSRDLYYFSILSFWSHGT